MEGFCDSDHYLHNVLAPTKHNAVCNYRSTWDIISSHSDFQKRYFYLVCYFSTYVYDFTNSATIRACKIS